MENKNSQNAKEMTEIKKQLIEQAVTEIKDIQLTGQTARAQIDAMKGCVLEAIQADNTQKQVEDALTMAKRAELLNKLSDAARAGNLSEMQRLKKLLGSI